MSDEQNEIKLLLSSNTPALSSVESDLAQWFKELLGQDALVMPNGKVYGEKYGGCFIPVERVEPEPVKVTAIVKYEGDDD